MLSEGINECSTRGRDCQKCRMTKKITKPSSESTAFSYTQVRALDRFTVLTCLMGVCGSKGPKQSPSITPREEKDQGVEQSLRHNPYDLRISSLDGVGSVDSGAGSSPVELVRALSRPGSGASSVRSGHGLHLLSLTPISEPPARSTPGFRLDDAPFVRSSLDKTTPKRETPSIVLSNYSTYPVSYSVIQEDKMILTEHHERKTHSVDLKLKVGNSGGALSAGVKKEAEDETTKTEDLRHFLLKDHRMAPWHETQETTQFCSRQTAKKCESLPPSRTGTVSGGSTRTRSTAQDGPRISHIFLTR